MNGDRFKRRHNVLFNQFISSIHTQLLVTDNKGRSETTGREGTFVFREAVVASNAPSMYMYGELTTQSRLVTSSARPAGHGFRLTPVGGQHVDTHS